MISVKPNGENNYLLLAGYNPKACSAPNRSILVMQICAFWPQHLDILQNDPDFSCWVCTDCLSWHCKQCSLSAVSHSGGRAHSGSATVRCLCCWQRSFISARVSVYFNSCGLELYSLIPMTSSGPFFSGWMVCCFLLKRSEETFGSLHVIAAV